MDLPFNHFLVSFQALITNNGRASSMKIFCFYVSFAAKINISGLLDSNIMKLRWTFSPYFVMFSGNIDSLGNQENKCWTVHKENHC